MKFIEKAFDWTLEVDGKAWADGKLPQCAARGGHLTDDIALYRQELQVNVSSRPKYPTIVLPCMRSRPVPSPRPMLFNEYKFTTISNPTLERLPFSIHDLRVHCRPWFLFTSNVHR